MIKNKLKLLCTSYFTKNSIIKIMRILIRKKEMIALINKRKKKHDNNDIDQKDQRLFKNKMQIQFENKNNRKIIYEYEKRFFKNKHFWN